MPSTTLPAGVKPFEECRRTIRALAFKGLQRAHAAGYRTLQLEDVEQEMAITWIAAAERFDASHGVAFSTYFQTAVWQNFNRWLERELRVVHQTPISLDLGGSLLCSTNDQDLHGVLADPDQVLPEETVIMAERRRRVMNSRKLSPLALKFLELLDNPPPELHQEVDRLRTRVEHARTRGHQAPGVPRQITRDQIAELMGLSRTERKRIYGELRSFADKLNQI